MSNINEILAKLIVDKLKEEKLIKDSSQQLVSKLSNGSMRDADWRTALEEMINNQMNTTEKNEAK